MVMMDFKDVHWKENGRLKLLIIVGTRPEIIRLSAVINKTRQYFESEEGRLQLSRQTEALEQKEAAPALQPAPPLIFCALFVCRHKNNKSEPFPNQEKVRIY